MTFSPKRKASGAQGGSIIDAGIHDGDIIIVDKSNRTPDEHEVAVCELNGEYTIKHVLQEDGRAWLVPANPKYPRIEITENDAFSVWGVVTYTIHKPLKSAEAKNPPRCGLKSGLGSLWHSENSAKLC